MLAVESPTRTQTSCAVHWVAVRTVWQQAQRPPTHLPPARFLSQCAEDELRYALGLANLTTGKGKVDMKESGIRWGHMHQHNKIGLQRAAI